MHAPLERETAAPTAIGNGGKENISHRKSSRSKNPRQERWKQANPIKVWAHQALRSAVRRGLVIQECCAECGDPNAEAHHDDYERPMSVRWLCRLHHKAEHRRLKCEAEA